MQIGNIFKIYFPHRLYTPHQATACWSGGPSTSTMYYVLLIELASTRSTALSISMSSSMNNNYTIIL